MVTKAQVKNAAKKVLKFAKEKRLLSRGLGLIPNPVAQVAARGVALAGYGRRRRRATTTKRAAVRRRRVVKRRIPVLIGRGAQKGKGFLSDLGSGLGSVAYGVGGGIGRIASGLIHGRGRKRRATKRVGRRRR